ncbi:MAG: cytochrome c [Gammaproteobacteria bacterium]|nr:cytochrome c [Gammaproteobacteria bacterium]
MCKWSKWAALALVCATASAWAGERYPGIGRAATAAELQAWDIDVRADFQGLPEGEGSVARGRELYGAQCVACHGGAGESDAFFTPLIGGTTSDDIRTGHAQALANSATAQRTTFMRLPTLSTLFDYIQRAMPWEAPKSLPPDDVYALTAYLLHLAGIVPETFSLSHSNVADLQGRLPNRHGMTTDHGLWPGPPDAEGGMGNGGIPDVRAARCMSDCRPGDGN